MAITTIIEARVIQKVATEQEWNETDLLLYQGEAAYVSDKFNFKLNTQELPKRFSELEYYYKGDVVGTVTTTEDLSLKSDGVYYAQTSGTYAGVVVREGYYTLLRKSNDVWSIASEVKMPTATPTGIVYPENPNAVSGGEVYNSQKHINDSLFDIRISPNLFDKSTMIKTGAYVLSSPIDAGLRTIANWDMVIIPISPNTQYTISGWNTARSEIGFYSEIVNPNDIPSTGGYTTNLIKTGISSNIGYGAKSNGKLTFTSPSNAKCLVLTIKNATETTSVYSQLQVELGAVATDYQDYGTTEYQLKDGVLGGSDSIFEVNLSQTEESYILTQTLKGEKIKQIIKPFREIYYPFDVGNVLVNNNLVAEWTDETAPFRFDGTTLGGNHEANLHNKNRTFALFVDGEKVSDFNKKYYPKQNFSVVESYDIEGVTTTGVVAKASLTYVFDKRGGCTIYTDVYAIKNMAFQDIMFVMANNLNGTLLNYIPKSKSFTYNSVVYDFTTKYSMDGFAPASRLDFVPSRYESIPDRLIALNERIGFAIGYLPLEDTAPSVRPINAPRKALQIHNTTKKIYMSAIDNASKTTINAGEYFSTIVYKVFYSLDSTYTANYVVETNDSYYLYLDFHTSGLKNIKIPNELSGLITELVESKDAILVSKPKGDILVNVSSTYAYLVIRFKK